MNVVYKLSLSLISKQCNVIYKSPLGCEGIAFKDIQFNEIDLDLVIR